MRGKIIHYNGSDGRGLIATPEQQWPFDIGLWRSDVAPAPNQTVELLIKDGSLQAVTCIPESILLKEKVGALAGRLGNAGVDVLGSLRSNARGSAAGPAGIVARLGKPLLIAQVVFAISALFLPYLKIGNSLGFGGQSFSLLGLSDLSQRLGTSVGGTLLPWLGILAIAVPALWRSRWAWLALLLPLLATLKPAWDLYRAVRVAARQMEAVGGGFAGAMAEQLARMLDIGAGAWLCLLSSLLIAIFALKRALLPPSGDVQ